MKQRTGKLLLAAVAITVPLVVSSCSDTGTERILSVESDGAVTGQVYLDRNGDEVQDVLDEPVDGLEIRPVPNRNADPTGHIEGGREVRVVRRSGIWARIEVGEESQDPIWVKRRELEPIESPAETPGPGEVVS